MFDMYHVLLLIRAGTASQFQEMELTVYNSLFTLIKDTCVLRDYAAAALLIVNVSITLPALSTPRWQSYWW